MAGFGLPNFGQITEAFKKAKQIQQDAQKLARRTWINGNFWREWRWINQSMD